MEPQVNPTGALVQQLHQVNESFKPSHDSWMGRAWSYVVPKKSYSLSEIHTMLHANEILLKANPNNPDLQIELATLKHNINQLTENSPIRDGLRSDLHHILVNKGGAQLSPIEKMLEEIEAGILPDYFPPFKRENGRLVDPAIQLYEFEQRLESHEALLKKKGFKIKANNEHTLKALVARAQFIADVNFLILFDTVEWYRNWIIAVATKAWHEQKRSEWIGNPSQYAAKRRIELANRPIQQVHYPPLRLETTTLVPPEIKFIHHHGLSISCITDYLPVSLAEMNWITDLTILGIMQEFPKQVFALPHLERLWLCSQGIKIVPEEIGTLQNLSNFTLLASIEHLPASFGNLTALVNLNLQKNHLSEIPSWIGFLQQLRFLYVRGNPSVTVAEEIGNCTRLEQLYCGDDALLPDQLVNCSHLRFVGSFAETHWDPQLPNTPPLAQALASWQKPKG